MKILTLPSLQRERERSRLRGNLIEVCKWHRNSNKGGMSKGCSISNQAKTRNYWFNLEKFRFEKEIRVGRNWFSNRMVDDWNRLSIFVGSDESIGRFKRRLDECMHENDR